MKKNIPLLIFLLLIVIGAGVYIHIRKATEKEKYIPQPAVAWIETEHIETLKKNEMNVDLPLTEKWIPKEALFSLGIHGDYNKQEKVVVFSNGVHTQWIDLSKKEMESIIKGDEKQFWIQAENLDEDFGIQADFNESSQTLLVKKEDQVYTLSKVEEDAELISPESPERFIKKIKKGQTVVGFFSENEKTQVMTLDYQVGEVFSRKLGTFYKNKEEESVPKKEKEKIFLAWDVYKSKVNTSSMGKKRGIHILSQTGYALADEKGRLSKKVNKESILWARQNGYKLWPLVSNDFNPKRTHAFLKSPLSRKRFIEKLVKEWTELNYEGINIDFENVYKADKDKLSQFVAELCAEFRKEKIITSIDVTIKGGSDNWSKCYDRKALGRLVDYMAVMTYDQHWANSPVSGSVASYDWVKKGIVAIIEDVPSEKLLLGIPYYMRVWTEVPSKKKADTMNVKSAVLSLKYMKDYIEKRNLNLIWDEKSRQYYAAYFDEDSLKKIWFEEERSIKEKVSLVDDLNLAGVAVWRRGFEVPEIWDTISEVLYKRK